MFNVVLERVDYFQDICIETKLDFVSFDDKNRRRKFVSERDFLIQKLLYWSGSMSESQQGPEICDVII